MKARLKSTIPITHFSLHIYLVLALAWLAFGVTPSRATTYTLGTTTLLEGPAAGTDSVVLAVSPPTDPWTATTNASWLHLSTPNQSGVGSTNVIFAFDGNTGPTRSGTLTISGQILTITQAGSNYISTRVLTQLGPVSMFVYGVAVDGTGNVYFTDTRSNAIRKWLVAGNAITTLVASNLNGPQGVAVDAAGNVYIADTTNNAIKMWSPASSNLTTLVSGLNHPHGVAVNGVGNVYIADSGNNAIKLWTAGTSNLTTLVSTNLNQPYGVAVDTAGNVYIADYNNNAIKEWTVANSNLTTLVPGVSLPGGVAVDGAGNVYISAGGARGFQEWSPANKSLTNLGTYSGTTFISGIAVDHSGNVYFTDLANMAIAEVPYAFVDPTPKLESLAGGSDALPAVLPATQNLAAPSAIVRDQGWLTVTSTTNGVINFSVSASTNNRYATLTVLGQPIPVMQGGVAYTLGTTSPLEGPSAGADTILLNVLPVTNTWTAIANDSWLHVTNQTGTGDGYVIFGFDANPGPTRTGSLTVSGQTVTVTQAGTTYVLARPLTTLIFSGVSSAFGIAVDGSGNLYIADNGSKAIEKWTRSNNAVTTLISGLNSPVGVAVDGSENVYIEDTGTNAVYRWSEVDTNLTAVIAPGVLHLSGGPVVDPSGNVYVGDSASGFNYKWSPFSSNLTKVIYMADYQPTGIGADNVGNVYAVDQIQNETFKVTPVNEMILPCNAYPRDVAVDGSGNVYTGSLVSNVIYRCSLATGTFSPFVSQGVFGYSGLAADPIGNLYIAAGGVAEIPYTFVDPSSKFESAAAGTDSLPAVLPATANLAGSFAPTNDQPWLTITGVANGVVNFSFTSNLTGSNRTANITLLGQTIPITQSYILPPLLTGGKILGNGAFQFGFSNSQTASFTVLSTTNLSLPVTNWTVLGALSNIAPGVFQFTGQPMTNGSQRFYTVRSP